ncbi:MAG: xanthine dehydrogenase family protein subunit M [Planctomycetes bacterium]|nr:xanthine dehydrogenase family protein subunit M [Planctomycetota bacterium]
MKSFTLLNPKTLEHATRALAAAPSSSARVLAGGQDLLTEMKEHLVEPEQLVNLKGIPGLDRIEFTAAGACTIGALVTIGALEEHAGVRERLRLLAEAAASVGSPQIRTVGTVGGNLCQRPRCWYYRSEHAKCLKKGGDECFSFSGMNKYNAILAGGPSYIVHPSDLAPALVALGASATLVSAAGERTVPLEEFFTLPSAGDVKHENVLRQGEVLTKVLVPAPEAGLSSTYLKFRERGSYDFALASVALCLWRDGARIRKARVALGGVAPVPWRSFPTEKALEGAAFEPSTFEKAAAAAVTGAEPLGQNDYKIPLTKGLVVRALQSLA